MPKGTSEQGDVTMIGRIIIDQGLASAEQVDGVLSRWRERRSGNGASVEAERDRLGELLVAQGVVTRPQLERVRMLADQSRAPEQIPGFRVLDKIGEGAMAKVFRAKQVSLDRMVAIKVLPKKHTEDSAFIERFYAEGRSAARLNHPNIVQAFDVGRAGDHHYFIMEYVEGTTVFDQVQEHGRYDEAEALRIIIQIADALNHAHEKGFMHRDVKPKNIMINRQGVAKLADMGLARQVSDKEAAEAEAGKAFGTPFYISPEQIRGAVDVDHRADIYGLGATFYYMVTGRVPFDGPNPSAVMHKHLRQPLTPPDHVNPQLTAGVSEIIEVMMAKAPGERYASCADLLEDLRAVQAGNPPILARKKYSIASLAAIEAAAGDTEPEPTYDLGPPPLVEQPAFWVAVASGILNVALLVILLIR